MCVRDSVLLAAILLLHAYANMLGINGFLCLCPTAHVQSYVSLYTGLSYAVVCASLIWEGLETISLVGVGAIAGKEPCCGPVCMVYLSQWI